MRRISCRQGFTLLEVLMALSLFTLGLLAVAALQGSALRAATGNELRSQGRAAAKSLTETLMALPYDHDHWRDANGNGRAGLDDRDDEETPADHVWQSPERTDLRVVWNIAEEDPAPGTKTLRVIALWSERGADKSFSLEYIRSAGF